MSKLYEKRTVKIMDTQIIKDLQNQIIQSKDKISNYSDYLKFTNNCVLDLVNYDELSFTEDLLLIFINDEVRGTETSYKASKWALSVLKDELEVCQNRMKLRTERLEAQKAQHAPAFILKGEYELIAKSYLEIALLNRFIEEFTEFTKITPEEKLLRAIFGM